MFINDIQMNNINFDLYLRDEIMNIENEVNEMLKQEFADAIDSTTILYVVILLAIILIIAFCLSFN